MLSLSKYPVDNHVLQSKDGYKLVLLRLQTNALEAHGLKTGDKIDSEVQNKAPRPPVLICHGLMAAGTEWLCNVPEKTLPFVLAQENYDVWMICQRGTRLSVAQGHTQYTPKQKKFWDFGPDEMGMEDIPVAIDYILTFTGHQSLYYIGHSLGCAVFFIALSSRPEYNQKVKMMIGFSPAVYGHHHRHMLTNFTGPPLRLMSKSKALYRTSALTWSTDKILKKIVPCFPIKEIDCLCSKCWKIISKTQVDKEQAKEICKTIPGGSSMKTCCHLLQAEQSKKFQKYDYGQRENMKRYGQAHPPTYDLGKVKVPVALFAAVDDLIIVPEDVQQVYKEIGNGVYFKTIKERKFYHGDFMFGKDAKRLAYDSVVRLFNDHREKELDVSVTDTKSETISKL